MKTIDAIGLVGTTVCCTSLVGLALCMREGHYVFWCLLGLAFAALAIAAIWEVVQDIRNGPAGKKKKKRRLSIQVGSIIHFADGISKTVRSIEDPVPVPE